MADLLPCSECGKVHVSPKGRQYSHRKWASMQKMNSPDGPKAKAHAAKKAAREALAKEAAAESLAGMVAAVEVEKGPDDGIRQDFAQEVMDVYGRMKGGVRGRSPLDKYAWEDPARYIERCVLPVALKQVVSEDPDADRKREQRMVEEDAVKQQRALEGFMEEWTEAAR